MDNQLQQLIIRQNKRDKLIEQQINDIEQKHNDIIMMLQHVSEQLADLRSEKRRVKKVE